MYHHVDFKVFYGMKLRLQLHIFLKANRVGRSFSLVVGEKSSSILQNYVQSYFTSEIPLTLFKLQSDVYFTFFSTTDLLMDSRKSEACKLSIL